jgi:hypothetical protein
MTLNKRIVGDESEEDGKKKHKSMSRSFQSFQHSGDDVCDKPICNTDKRCGFTHEIG